MRIQFEEHGPNHVTSSSSSSSSSIQLLHQQLLPPTYKVVRLMKRPNGEIQPNVDLVVLEESTRPLLDQFIKHHQEQHGGGNNTSPSTPLLLLVKRIYLSLDPAMRGWMNDIPSYIPPVKLKSVMRGTTICQVVGVTGGGGSGGGGIAGGNSNQRRHPNSLFFHVGDYIVDGNLNGGWDEYAVVNGNYCRKINPSPTNPSSSNISLPITCHLSVLGMTGMTAYFGLLHTVTPPPKSGDTVLVSAAAGATGSLVCQIAKHVLGCKVIGIAGGTTKCQYLLNDLQCCDSVIDYKQTRDDPNGFQKQLKMALISINSKGIDIYFDNVGGYILNETFRRLHIGGRIIVCGGISNYNAAGSQRGDDIKFPPTNYMSLIPLRATMKGFIVLDYKSQFGKARKDITEWIQQGKIRYIPDDIKTLADGEGGGDAAGGGGLANAPYHLQQLFHGTNIGKLIVQIGTPIPSSLSSSLTAAATAEEDVYNEDYKASTTTNLRSRL